MKLWLRIRVKAHLIEAWVKLIWKWSLIYKFECAKLNKLFCMNLMRKLNEMQ
jgi:hypothetical protein